MAFPKTIHIKESTKELRSLQKTCKPLFRPRLQMLIVILNSDVPLSKIALSKRVGANHNSIQKWRKLYEQGGLSLLLSHKTNASRPSVFTQKEKEKIEKLLRNPNNGLQGYKELNQWVVENLDKKVKRNTLMVFCRKNFGTKIKVARKSHIKKDVLAVETFKKTLIVSSDKS